MVSSIYNILDVMPERSFLYPSEDNCKTTMRFRRKNLDIFTAFIKLWVIFSFQLDRNWLRVQIADMKSLFNRSFDKDLTHLNHCWANRNILEFMETQLSHNYPILLRVFPWTRIFFKKLGGV